MTTPDSTRRTARRKSAEKSPAFQLYTKDLLSDGNVMAMDLTEFGAYMKLMAVCWNERGLSNEPDTLARILHIPRESFDAIWINLAHCFYVSDGKLQHQRLDEERRKQSKFRKQRKLAAQSRWDKEHTSRNAVALHPQSSSSSSSSASSSAVVEESAAAPGPPPPVLKPRAVQGSGVMAGMLPRDHLNCHQPCERICVSEKQHAILRARHGGTDAEMDGFYADVRKHLNGPVAERPWQFWESQFIARFGGQKSSKTAGNQAVVERFAARGQQ